LLCRSFPDQFKTVHDRHADIRDDDIHFHPVQCFQGTHSIADDVGHMILFPACFTSISRFLWIALLSSAIST
jgi:hypothetical protein